MEVYSIGFTKKTAQQFFGVLRKFGIRRLLDVRLHNASQLAGFTKKENLEYFLREICDAEYVHEPLLAPTKELLDDYKKTKIGWNEYESGFLALMSDRRVEEKLDKHMFIAPTILLCSEPTPDRCHRRLVLEYFHEKWPDLVIHHL